MKIIKKIIIVIVLIVAIILGTYTYLGYNMYKTALEKVPLETKVETIKSQENFTTIDNLPDMYVKAVISVEDHRFYTHNGIDIIGISRAIFNDIKAKKLIEGGSTITQQLAKNIYFTQDKKLTRKIAETFMAFNIEKNYNKDEIFELYVNTSYFGDGYYCVHDASTGYFNKNPEKMTNYESTLLAGIPNAPSIYAPTKNLELAKQRQKQVINKMIKYNNISQEEADNILKTQQKTYEKS